MNINKTTALHLLAEKIVKDKICEHLALPGIKLVMGEGNPDADILLIGEAPGKEENRTGRPFVGASGKLLDELLASINLVRADIFITNIVKYQPPNNRDPEAEEKLAFRPYLDQQIEIIKPRVIVTLGRHPLNEFLPKAFISKIHGVAQAEQNPPVFPLYHPAAALYNVNMRQVLFDDFKKLSDFLGKSLND